MRTECFRILPGQDLFQEIERRCIEHDLTAAAVIACAGCLRNIRFRMADGISVFEIREDAEIVSLSGTCCPDGLHIHISVCNQNLKTYGGHLFPGCIVNTTAEVVLAALDEWQFNRKPDPVTGYDELCAERRKNDE